MRARAPLTTGALTAGALTTGAGAGAGEGEGEGEGEGDTRSQFVGIETSRRADPKQQRMRAARRLPNE